MTSPTTKTPLFSDRVYNFLKFISLVLLPAVATMYLTLAPVWDLPQPERVVVTITAVDTFLGLLLGQTSKNYQKQLAAQQDNQSYDGSLIVAGDEDGKYFALQSDQDPDVLANKTEVRLKVDPKGE